MEMIALRVGHALLMSLGMFWNVGWSLVLGFLISATLQVCVSKERMRALLGGNGIGQIALATGFGAASSSCSYASASITRTLVQKGAGFIPALAFLFSSTNLVIELGIILLLLMGWQFMAAEWLGGIVLVAVMSILVRLTCPAGLIAEARQKAGQTAAPADHHDMHHAHHAEHQEMQPAESGGFLEKLRRKDTRLAVAQNFVMDWAMLGKDLAVGFLIAGFLAEFVPNHVWQSLFATSANAQIQTLLNAATGPLIAVVSFVCSIGNVPMAAILWQGGISFGGVLAFLYADLLVLPLLDTYRRYFGWKMAAYIAAVFYVTMVVSAIVMDAVFSAFGWTPHPGSAVRAEMTHFAVNYTFWLNLGFGALAFYLFRLAARKPAPAKSCCMHH